MPRTRKQPILYTYTITRTDIGFADRPRDIQNLGQLILPIKKILYFGLSIVLFVSNIRVQKNVDSNHYDIN